MKGNILKIRKWRYRIPTFSGWQVTK